MYSRLLYELILFGKRSFYIKVLEIGAAKKIIHGQWSCTFCTVIVFLAKIPSKANFILSVYNLSMLKFSAESTWRCDGDY